MLGALEWPFGAGPYTSEGQACIAANIVATRLNTMGQAASPAQAKAQFKQAGASIAALADAVQRQPQHGQFERLSSSIDATLRALARGDRQGALVASSAVAVEADAVNRWYASSCNAWTIRLPIWLNDVYAGGLPTFV